MRNVPSDTRSPLLPEAEEAGVGDTGAERGRPTAACTRQDMNRGSGAWEAEAQRTLLSAAAGQIVTGRQGISGR